MNKTAIVYFSSSGNTQAMAEAIAAGVQENGGSPCVFDCDNFKASMVKDYDSLAFGCSAMGDEELEDTTFEPMFSECEPSLCGKRVALFGSYGWGDGQWMRSWEERCKDNGISLSAESVICVESPDEYAVAACKALGKLLSE